MISNAHPNAADWPYVAIDGFNEIAADLIETSSGRGLTFIPIVHPDQVETFEAFAYDYYETKQRPPFEDIDAIGMSSFGRGIYAYHDSNTTTSCMTTNTTTTNTSDDNRYHDTTGNTSWCSKRHFMAPIFQIEVGDTNVERLLMFNHYSREDRGVIVDDTIECSEARAASGNLARLRNTGRSSESETAF